MSKTYIGVLFWMILNWKEIPLLIYVIFLAVIGGMVSSIEEQRKNGKTVPFMKQVHCKNDKRQC